MTLALDQDQVQGNVLHAYGTDFRAACHQFMEVVDAAAATCAIGDWIPEMKFGRDRDPGKQGVHVNVAFTYRGLERLGCPSDVLADFPEDFRAGAVARSHEHAGDRADNVPANWQPELKGKADVLLSVSGKDIERCREFLTTLVDAAARATTPLTDEPQEAGLLEHESEISKKKGTCGTEFDREHFGFADGCSQPMIGGGVDHQRRSGGVFGRVPRWGPIKLLEDVGLLDAKRDWRLLRPGEFVLGYDDEDGRPPAGPPAPLGPNGTFMVYRKLEQDVEAFDEVIERAAPELGLSINHLKEKVIGRSLDGVPLIEAPEGAESNAVAANAFSYGGDPWGTCCPLGAHIRRTNPRDALPGSWEVTTRHRMIRRGMPYGGKNAKERGLIFICYTTSIEQGFEFVQRVWCYEGQSFGLGDEQDYILQQRNEDGELSGMWIQGVGPLPAPERPLVIVRGCEYLFVPSRDGLQWIAGLHGAA